MDSNRVLLAEDEKRVAAFLMESLSAEGYSVTHCSNFAALKDQIEFGFESIDIAIFDRMLGREDSLDLIVAFKNKFPKAALLVLSAINSPEEKARSLDLGADDYLAKPYSLKELSARLRALKRRSAEGNEKSPRNQYLLNLKNATLNLLNHEMHINGKRVDLTAKEFKLFQCLSSHPGRVFNKFQILDQVWNTQLDLESNVVEATVRNLRRKLELAGAEFEISSRRNVGYWVEA